jgi:hypothetical protein
MAGADHMGLAWSELLTCDHPVILAIYGVMVLKVGASIRRARLVERGAHPVALGRGIRSDCNGLR